MLVVASRWEHFTYRPKHVSLVRKDLRFTLELSTFLYLKHSHVLWAYSFYVIQFICDCILVTSFISSRYALRTLSQSKTIIILVNKLNLYSLFAFICCYTCWILAWQFMLIMWTIRDTPCLHACIQNSLSLLWSSLMPYSCLQFSRCLLSVPRWTALRNPRSRYPRKRLKPRN